MHRRLGVPPRRSRREGVPSQSPRSRAFARESEGRGAEMRVVVLKLPRRGGDGSPSGTFGPASWPPRPDAPQSGVAQWQSIRLLTEGLWVRVPPPEYEPRFPADRVGSGASSPMSVRVTRTVGVITHRTVPAGGKGEGMLTKVVFDMSMSLDGFA